MPSKWCSASHITSKPSSSVSRASRRVSSITSPSRVGSRLSGNRKLLNFKGAPVGSASGFGRHAHIPELVHNVTQRVFRVVLHLKDRHRLRPHVAIRIERHVALQ